jgi:hypothetical protein
MTSATVFQVNAFWDADAAVWVATSEDVPGLATEAKSFDELQQKLRSMVPELLVLNQAISPDYKGSISFELITHTQETVEVA